MISMLELVEDSRMRQAFCGVLEKCSRAVNGYFMNWEKCSFPRMGESQFCNQILPLYCHVTSNWLTCEELGLKQAIIRDLGPMMGILLHKKEPPNPIFKEISWLLEQYKEEIDVFHVTKIISSSEQGLPSVVSGAVVAMLVQDIGATRTCFSWTQDTKESRSAQAGMATKGSRGALQAPAERLPVLQDSEASRTVAAADPQPPNARDGGETPESLRLPAAEERVGSSLGGRSIDPVEVAGLTQHALEGSPLSWWSLSQLLEVSVEYKIPLPKGKFQGICSALHNQICSPAKQLSIENHKDLFHCVLLLARSSPDDLLAFLHKQLEIEHEAVRVASLDFLRAIVGADLPETRVKKLLIVKAVKSTLSDQNAMVRKAALHFIRTLLSSGSVENCAAWDLVAYVFSEFSVSTSKLDVEEESTIQTLCIDILQCLDTSVNGMTQVLWPRLLEYVVPAQYMGTLKPLCRCLRELAEKKQREGEAAACLDYSGRVQLPTPQGLLARLLVVASSPYEREGHGCAALQLLKALHQTVHAAVGEMWGVKIPSLLQYIEAVPV
ncbi:unnamed protein product [Eretmochelys imbricata]